jgi:hypothetical protein
MIVPTTGITTPSTSNAIITTRNIATRRAAWNKPTTRSRRKSSTRNLGPGTPVSVSSIVSDSISLNGPAIIAAIEIKIEKLAIVSAMPARISSTLSAHVPGR